MRSIRLFILASVLVLGLNQQIRAQGPSYYGFGGFAPSMSYPFYPGRYGYGGWYGNYGNRYYYYPQTYNNLSGVAGAINNAIIIPTQLERRRAASYSHAPVHWCPYHRRLESGSGTMIPYRY